MSRRKKDFNTAIIRDNYTSGEHQHSVNVPIYQTAAFDLDAIGRARSLWTMAENGPIYSRVGNPTVTALEDKILSVSEKADAAVALSSGMAAITYTVLLLGEGGGNFVLGSSLYGGTQDAFRNLYSRHGIEGRFVEDRDDPKAYGELIDENTKGIFVESISNPNIELYDIDEIARIAHKNGVPVIVDNTIATPYLYDPFAHGADIVIYSATKELCGHGNAIAGLILEKGDFHYPEEKFPRFYEKSHKLRDLQGNARSAYDVNPRFPVITCIRSYYLDFGGAALGPMDAYLVLQGLATLPIRLDQQNRTTEKIVKYLEGRREVLWVQHPSATNSPYAELAKRDFSKGTGNIMSFGFDGTLEQINVFIQELQYFSYHVNVGDVRSLITNPTGTTHAELDEEGKKLTKIPDNLVRLSIGLESPEDLIDDLDHAFSVAFGL